MVTKWNASQSLLSDRNCRIPVLKPSTSQFYIHDPKYYFQKSEDFILKIS